MQNTVAAKLSNTIHLLRRSIRDNEQIAQDEQIQNCWQSIFAGKRSSMFAILQNR